MDSTHSATLPPNRTPHPAEKLSLPLGAVHLLQRQKIPTEVMHSNVSILGLLLLVLLAVHSVVDAKPQEQKVGK